MAIRRVHPRLDAVFDLWKDALGPAYRPYRNHAYRVFNIAAESSHASGDDLEKLAVAAAFHDVGIWLDGTFDYLEPSRLRAEKYLLGANKTSWIPEVRAMILNHHKVTPWRGLDEHFVDAFRRADWLDVCYFALPSKLPRGFLKQAASAFPRAGFHRLVAKVAYGWCKENPTRPLPMFKL